MEKCEKCGSKLEPDGICHACILERSKENVEPWADFGKKLSQLQKDLPKKSEK